MTPVILLLAGGCSAPAGVRGGPSTHVTSSTYKAASSGPSHEGHPDSGAPTTSPTATGPSGPRPTATIPGQSASAAAATAWIASERAFYRAGQLGDTNYPPLLASFAPGSPMVRRVVGWLTALQVAGVVAPPTYRIGAVRVTKSSGPTVTLAGCTYDSGSMYRSTGAPAPTSLGGGAGYTASTAVVHLVGDRWLVWSDQSSTVASNTVAGPCKGFA